MSILRRHNDPFWFCFWERRTLDADPPLASTYVSEDDLWAACARGSNVAVPILAGYVSERGNLTKFDRQDIDEMIRRERKAARTRSAT